MLEFKRNLALLGAISICLLSASASEAVTLNYSFGGGNETGTLMFDDTTGDLLSFEITASNHAPELIGLSGSFLRGTFTDERNFLGVVIFFDSFEFIPPNPSEPSRGTVFVSSSIDPSTEEPFLRIELEGLISQENCVERGVGADEFLCRRDGADIGDYVYREGGTFEVVDPTDVPEPASMIGLLAMGAVAVGGALKKQTAAAASSR